MQTGKKPRIWFISALLFLVVLLAACGGGGGATTTPTTSHTKAPAAQQVLLSGAEVGIPDFGTLDPGLVSSLSDAYAVDDLFVGMVQLNDQGLVYCELCSNYSVASDGVTWTFTLRPGLKFSDGTPLTSQDVVYSINRALDPKTLSPVGPYYLRYIKDAVAFSGGSKTIKTLIGDSLLAPDPQTVKIIAQSPLAFFLETLTYPTSYVVEKSVIDKWGKSWTDHLADNGGQGGSGPWKVQSYTHSKTFVVVPNANYWGPKPQLGKIVYTFIKSEDTSYQIYLVNQLDDTFVPVADIPTAKTRSDYHTNPSLSIFYYSMNYDIKPFDVVSCRQAFALALNKDLIAQNIYKGSVIASNHIVPNGEYGYDANLKGPDGTTATGGNATQAKSDLSACMQAQGYSSVSQFPAITLTYASAGQQSMRDEVAAAQQMFQNVLGISVKTNDIDFNKLVVDETGGCAANPLQFWALGWIADYPDPQDWLTLQFMKDGANNSMCYGQNKGPTAAQQQQVQQALQAADTNSNPTSRAAAYNQAEQSLINDVAWLPRFQSVGIIMRKACVQGVFDTSFGLTPPQDWAKIYISTDTPCAKSS